MNKLDRFTAMNFFLQNALAYSDSDNTYDCNSIIKQASGLCHLSPYYACLAGVTYI